MKTVWIALMFVGCGGAVETETAPPEPELEDCGLYAADEDGECRTSCETPDDCDQTKAATCWRNQCYVLL